MAFRKKLSSFLAWAKDQGIDYLLATNVGGQGSLTFRYTFVAGGVVTFATQGVPNMADTNYTVMVANHTGTVDPVVGLGNRKTTGFTVTGPSVNDVCEFFVTGNWLGSPTK